MQLITVKKQLSSKMLSHAICVLFSYNLCICWRWMIATYEFYYIVHAGFQHSYIRRSRVPQIACVVISVVLYSEVIYHKMSVLSLYLA